MSIKKIGKAVLVSFLDDIRYKLEDTGQIFLLSGKLTDEHKASYYSLQSPKYPFLANFSKTKEDLYQKELETYEFQRKHELDRLIAYVNSAVLSEPVKAYAILKKGNMSQKIYSVYKDNVYKFDRADYSSEQMLLQINDLEEDEKRKFEYLKNKANFVQQERGPIPKSVQREVWRRDQGKCVECGSQYKLEYDHILPFSKGGNNTDRNIQLLCETCNRRKHNNI